MRVWRSEVRMPRCSRLAVKGLQVPTGDVYRSARQECGCWVTYRVDRRGVKHLVGLSRKCGYAVELLQLRAQAEGDGEVNGWTARDYLRFLRDHAGCASSV